MHWMRLIAVVLAVVVSQSSFAEYNTDPWAGMYNTGGYNLLGFGSDLSSLGGYSGYGNYGSGYGYGYGSGSYGGSCGSFYGGCSSAYDTAGLYGSNYGLGSYGGYGSSYLGGGFDIDIDILLNGGMSGLYGAGYGYGGGYGTGLGCGLGGYSSTYSSGLGCGTGFGSGYDIGCSVGMCGTGGYSPYWCDTSLYGGNGYFGNTYSSGGWDINININLLTYTPSYIPTIGNCGGGIVSCPTGQPTRPTYPPVTYYPPTTYPPTTYPPTTYPPTTYPPTNYQPTRETIPNDPVRYDIPRSATHR